MVKLISEIDLDDISSDEVFFVDTNVKHLEISEQYSVVSGNISNEMIKNFLEDYENHFYDPIDFITVRYNTNGVINFITDDSDFKKDSNIVVYTYE